MKQIKILGVIAVALTLGLTACNQPKDGGKSDPAVSSKHTHKYGDWTVTKEATCTEDGSQERTCSVCGEKDVKTIKAAHKWSEWSVVQAATCQAVGSQKRTCSVCNEVETKEIPLADHTWGEWIPVVEATCEAGGSQKHVCSVCNTEETEDVQALGHSFVKDTDGNDVVTWTKEATCTEAGAGTKHCERCNQDIAYSVEALGHDIQLVDGEITPVEGKAAVRLYKCTRCDVSYMGFKANEPSADSKPHLVIGDDGGARFWGRPIGNALALSADGTSVNQQNGEVVYCSTETGDFFEYVFDLTAAQAAELDNCRLYCDAKPADYLNGTDFWAYGASNDEWTPGYYIDGADGHFEVDDAGQPVMVKDHARSVRAEDGSEAAGVELDSEVKMGKRIEDYRYILYVDGQVKEFDPDITAPTHGNNANMQREEFVLPYTFNLHEGENRISLRMAGGYRSTFYNFTFRPVEESSGGQETHTHKYADAKSGTLETAGCTTVDVYNCVDGDASALRWVATAYDATSNEIEAPASDGSIRFNRAQGKNGEDDKGGHLVYKINSPVAAKDVNLDFYIQAHNQNVAIFDAVANDSGAGKDVDADGKYTVTPTKRYALYVNDQRVELGDDPGASTAKAWFTFPAKFDLNAGENKIEIVSLGGYRAKMYNFQLSGLPKISIPVKTWSSEDIANGLTAGNSLTVKDFNNSLPGVKGYKFNSASVNCTLTVNCEAAGTFDLELLLGVKSGNQSKTGFWYQVDSSQDPKPAKDKITVNGTDVVPPANDVDFSDCTTASDQSDNGTLMVPQWKTVCQVSLNAGENTIVITYLAGGYSLYLCGARLSK